MRPSDPPRAGRHPSPIRLALGAAFVLMTAGSGWAQSLINFPSKAPPTGEQPAEVPPPTAEYRPVRPPAASDPGVLQAPDLVARELNETDASYTARMTRLQDQLKSQDAEAQRQLAQVLQQVNSTNGGRAEPGVVLPEMKNHISPSLIREPSPQDRVRAERIRERLNRPQQQF